MDCLKIFNHMIGLVEVPDEISLCLNISGCPHHCHGCHSKHLRQDVGTPLTPELLSKLIDIHEGLTCVCFMGGDQKPRQLIELTKIVHSKGLKTALYSGATPTEFPMIFLNFRYFDYIKIGPYCEELGGLDNPNTNQRMLQWNPDEKAWSNITYKFQNKPQNQ